MHMYMYSYAYDVRTYQKELVRHSAIWRQPRAEAERREELVAVVVLNDLADRS